MKTSPSPATVRTLRAENAELRARLAEAEDTLHAIRAGDVDALVVEGDNGLQIFTLQGLDAEQNRSRGEMLAQVSDSVIAVDNEEHITFLNATAERQYGVRADEVVGRKLDSMVTRYWPSPEAEAGMLTAMSERGEWHGELIHRTHDGRELHIESSVAALRGPDGERIGVVRTIRDVSERQRLELEKAEALRLLDTLLTHAPVGFAYFDLELRFVRINEQLAEINGFPIAAHLGKTVTEILPHLAPALKEMAAHILTTGQPALDREFTGETASAPGVTRNWNASWYPVHDTRGAIIGFGAVVDDITERKQAEEALRHNERRFRGIFDSAFQFIGLMSPDGTLLEVNRTALEGGGLRAENVIGKPFWECDWWTLNERTGRELRTAIGRAGSGELVRYDVDVRGAEGQVVTLDFSIKPIRDEAGRVVLLIPEGRDITCLKRAEAALIASRKQLQAIIDGTPAIAYAFDREARFLLANATLANLLGTTQEQMLGKTRHDFMTPKDAEWHEANDQQVRESGKLLEVEEYSEHDGRVVSWLTSKFPLRDAQGEIYAVAGISADISKRKENEAALQGSEAKLREQVARLALLNQITRAVSNHLDFRHILQVVTDNLEDNLPVDFCCVCLFDEPARNGEVAQVGTRSAPLAREMAMPEHTVISLDCDALSKVAFGELSYLPDVREMAFPFPQRLAEGGLRSLVLAPLPLEGKVIGFLLVARRATDSFAESECEFLRQLGEHVALAYQQAKLHDALQTAYDELRRTQQAAVQRERLRALGEMASGITHDINNAISPVTLYTASLLAHEPNLSVRARDYIQAIHQSVKNVAETIARMREFYRPGEPQSVLTPIRLNHLVEQALDLTRVRWSVSPQERGILIQTDVQLAEDLPDIMGVESEIRDAIVNLIFNAVDAMPEGGTLTLRTMTKPVAPGTGGTRGARSACLELIDTGIGMDEETRRRCLEPFFTTKGEHGSGLGLAMVYGMITRHQAGIGIESISGQGTTVRMLFPLFDVASIDVFQPLKPEPAIQRILFIDDDPLVIKSMRDTLETEGHTVVTAAGGQEGIDAFIQAEERNESFTVVITDLGMPHVDGRKVASAVKAAAPSTPVIMLTGWGAQLEADGDIPAEVDRLLCKPPELRELREALAACCPPGQSQPTKA